MGVVRMVFLSYGLPFVPTPYFFRHFLFFGGVISYGLPFIWSSVYWICENSFVLTVHYRRPRLSTGGAGGGGIPRIILGLVSGVRVKQIDPPRMMLKIGYIYVIWVAGSKNGISYLPRLL